MKHTIIGCLLASLLLAGIIGCNNQPVTVDPGETVTLTPSAGAFGLSQLEGLGKRQAVTGVKDGADAQFNLGNIKASTGFYFLLFNIGTTPITNISLSTADDGYSVYPNTMDSLPPGSDVAMVPIVKVNVFHGTPLDGIGNRPVLPMGANTFTLLISGNTKTSNGSDTTIELQAQMDINALILDFECEINNSVIDLSVDNPEYLELYNCVPELRNKPISRYQSSCGSDSVIHFKNTGNTDVTLQIFRPIPGVISLNETTAEKTLDTLIEPGISLPVLFNMTLENKEIVFAVSGRNTICDPDRIWQHTDGTCYLRFEYVNYPCEAADRKTVYDDFLSAQNQSYPMIHAVIDSNLMFYGELRNDLEAPVYYFTLRDLDNNSSICTQTGTIDNLEKECTDNSYAALLDTIVTYLLSSSTDSYMDIRTFGLENGRVSHGGSNKWFDR